MSVCLNEQLSSSCSVQNWIDLLPKPERLFRQKRKLCDHDATHTCQPERKRRAPLQKISNNIKFHDSEYSEEEMSDSGAKRGRALRPSTPRRARGSRGGSASKDSAAETQQVDAHNEEASDGNPTPRAPSQLSFLPQEQRSSNSSTRSQSPVKMAGLKNIHGGLEYVMIDSNDVLEDVGHPLHEIAGLLEALDDFSQGVGVLPSTMLEIRQDRKHQRDFRHHHHFDNSGKRARLGKAPDISEVARLYAQTEEYEIEQEHEAAWNCAVHWPIARLALDLSAHTDSLQLKNITVAKIQPPALGPSRATGSKLQKKMVDLAYVLKPSSATNTGFSNLDIEPDAPSESFNQTCLNTIIDKPLAISIETKSGTVAGDEGLTQLSIWVHAHFAKLRQLTISARDKSELPATLPALVLAIAHGAKWTFLVASQDQVGKLTLWRYRNDMTTNTKIGVYEVVAALQLVLDWAQTQFRPWFEANALPLTPEQRQTLGFIPE